MLFDLETHVWYNQEGRLTVPFAVVATAVAIT